MRRIVRLLTYLRPYSVYALVSVVLMAIVGAMSALRILLVKPILDNVLSADAQPRNILIFTLPRLHWTINLQRFVPHQFHNAWTIVAFAGVSGSEVSV